MVQKHNPGSKYCPYLVFINTKPMCDCQNITFMPLTSTVQLKSRNFLNVFTVLINFLIHSNVLYENELYLKNHTKSKTELEVIE